MSKKMTIIHAATRMFARKGFKDTSMADLSTVTGAAVGTILYHFKSKEALFIAILADVKHRIIHDSNQYFSQRQYLTGMDMLEGVISFYFHLSEMMEDQFLLLHRHDAHRLSEENPECRRHLEAIFNCLLDIFEKAVQLGQKDGTMRDLSTRKAALILFSMVDGIVRLNTYRLYDGSALYQELVLACRRMLQV